MRAKAGIFELDFVGFLFGLAIAAYYAPGRPVLLCCDNMGARGGVVRGSCATFLGRMISSIFSERRREFRLRSLGLFRLARSECGRPAAPCVRACPGGSAPKRPPCRYTIPVSPHHVCETHALGITIPDRSRNHQICQWAALSGAVLPPWSEGAR